MSWKISGWNIIKLYQNNITTPITNRGKYLARILSTRIKVTRQIKLISKFSFETHDTDHILKMENWYRGSEFWWKVQKSWSYSIPQGEGKWKFYPINPEPMFANIHHQEWSFGKNWISISILMLISIYPLFANIHHQEGIFTQLIQCLQTFIKFWENLNIKTEAKLWSGNWLAAVWTAVSNMSRQ